MVPDLVLQYIEERALYPFDGAALDGGESERAKEGAGEGEALEP